MLSLRSLRLWVENGYWTWVMYQVGPCNCMMMVFINRRFFGIPDLGVYLESRVWK